jgi:hypothetical protein
MRRLFIYFLIMLLSVLITVLWWPLNDSDCNATAFLASKTKKIQVKATKVVVQPWLGEHQVYGIFTVPDAYKNTPFFIMSVKGGESDCSRPFGNSEYYAGVFAKPETHLIRYYMRTRMALRLIFQGLYFQLNDPQNWTLTFPQQKNN